MRVNRLAALQQSQIISPPVDWDVISSRGLRSQAPYLWRDLKIAWLASQQTANLAQRSIGQLSPTRPVLVLRPRGPALELLKSSTNYVELAETYAELGLISWDELSVVHTGAHTATTAGEEVLIGVRDTGNKGWAVGFGRFTGTQPNILGNHQVTFQGVALYENSTDVPALDPATWGWSIRNTDSFTSYYNGENVGVTSVGTVTITTRTDVPVEIGRRSDGGGAFSPIESDSNNVLVWTRSLSDAEHEELGFDPFVWMRPRPILVSVPAVTGITGTISQTLSAITQSASGTVQQQVTGTTSQTLSAVSQSATGTTQQLLTGTVAQTLSPISQSATGTVQDLLTGTISQTLSALSQSATAAITFSGTISQTLSPISQSATGTVGDVVIGSITQTLSPITQSLTGSLNFQATIAQTLSPISQSLTGTNAVNLTGTISQTLSAIQLALTEQAQFTGTVSMTLPALTMSLSGFNITDQVLPSNRVIFDTADARIVIDGADGRIVYDEPDSRTQADG